MPATHDVAGTLRCLSVQAGLAGGALTAALGAFQGGVAAMHVAVVVPPGAFVAAGVLTAVGVFAGRMWPRGNLRSG